MPPVHDMLDRWQGKFTTYRVKRRQDNGIDYQALSHLVHMMLKPFRAKQAWHTRRSDSAPKHDGLQVNRNDLGAKFVLGIEGSESKAIAQNGCWPFGRFGRHDVELWPNRRFDHFAIEIRKRAKGVPKIRVVDALMEGRAVTYFNEIETEFGRKT